LICRLQGQQHVHSVSWIRSQHQDKLLTAVQQLKAKTDIVTATIMCQQTVSTATVQPTDVQFHSEVVEQPTKMIKIAAKDFWSA
jgi:DNA-binding protein YbaB